MCAPRMLRASLETPRCRPYRSETEGQPLQRPGLDVRHDDVLPRRVRRALRDAGAVRLSEDSHVRGLQAGRRTFEGVLRAHAPASMGPKHVGAYLDLRAKSGRPVQGNRERALLSTCITSLPRTGKASVGFNPCRGVKRNKETKRERCVELEEYHAAWAIAASRVRGLLRLTYRTVQRSGDIIH